VLLPTIALVDDHRLFREGLRALLESQPGFSVAGEAADGREARAMVRETRPDVVVLDVFLPGASGIQVARDLLRDDPQLKVIALSMVHDEQHVVEALDAGVLGYASKEQSAEEVISAILAVSQRQPYLAPFISRAALDEYRRTRQAAASPLDILTRREREVFDLTVAGGVTADIGRQLFISRRTVETHRARILRKLNAHSATDLVRLAARLGLLPP
jgi:DNA-binding NarL/FixJ family response regulator